MIDFDGLTTNKDNPTIKFNWTKESTTAVPLWGLSLRTSSRVPPRKDKFWK